MNKSKVFSGLIITLLCFNVSADKNRFLTVEALVNDGYTLLSGLQIIKVMNKNTIKVVDIETDAVNVSENEDSSAAIDRKFVVEKSDKPSTVLDVKLMARAPALDGKIERKVAGDELIVTNGVRTYKYRLYKKQDNIFAARDIDHGNVFFKVEVN